MKTFLLALAIAASASAAACTCTEARAVQPGMVRYRGNSDREIVSSVEPGCSGVWIAGTEIHPSGTPYRFHLERIKLHARMVNACDGVFVQRDKSYQFVFDADSTSIREMRLSAPSSPTPDASAQSNRNLWSAIVVNRSTDRRVPRDQPRIDPTRELNRTAWVLARRKIRGYFVGRVEDAGQNEKLVALKKTRMIEAGQLGQIEAIGERSVIVRFYEGSRIETFGGNKDVLRRWYANLGGPYSEVKDDLYTSIRAEILEVSIDDVVEVNDYLDQKQTDRT
jgi:hypothetical protein